MISRFLFLVGLVLLTLVPACSKDEGVMGAGSGGTGTSGGETHSGGADHAAGGQASGGTNLGTGGIENDGGADGSGGDAEGSGGQSGSGGNTPVCPDKVIDDSVTVLSVDELGALTGVTQITGDLTIGKVPDYSSGEQTLAFPSLAALACLQTVGQNFTIQSTHDLETLDDLGSLNSVGDLTLSGNAHLTDVSALHELTRVGVLWISGNANLESVEGLEGITRVDAMTVAFNFYLASIDGLSGITHVDGEFRFVQNTSLPTCEVEALRARIGDENISGEVTIDGGSDDPCDP